MSHVDHTHDEDSSVQQYFTHLDRWDKVANWIYGAIIVCCVLLTIAAGIILLS